METEIMLELSPKAQAVIEKVKKLLALANDERNNEHQAAAAAAKAQELLEAYNLDMAIVGKTAKGPQGGRREDTRLKGGLYKWQRRLWEAVADLNFCMYWSIKGLSKGSTYEHRILGRQENVIGAQVMADYLQQTVERLAQETARDREVNVFAREMVAYREGMAQRLVERLQRLRREKLQAEKERQRQEMEQARANGPSNPHGLVLASLIEDENALNLDHLYGYEPGTTARRRREAELRYRQEVEARKRWREENPEEAARLDAQRQKEYEQEMKRQERNRRRRTGSYREREPTAEERRQMLPEYDEGYERGDDVSLNQQVDEGDDRHRLI
jgi:hypothetical protein